MEREFTGDYGKSDLLIVSDETLSFTDSFFDFSGIRSRPNNTTVGLPFMPDLESANTSDRRWHE